MWIAVRMSRFEANFRQKIFDARFLHDRVTGEKSLFYEQIGGFCRATIFIKDTFFSDHSKVEQKAREGRVENEADARKCDFALIWFDLILLCSVHEGSEATLGPPQEGRGF